MSGDLNPALQAFVQWLGDGAVVAQVRIRRAQSAFDLCHIEDAAADLASLKLVDVAGLRQLASTTEHGEFRPLKTAPNLRRGWRAHATGPQELDDALRHLYPGAVADWFAVQQNPIPLTGFREFTDRQTGMYRTASLLSDVNAEEAIRATCDSRVCLRRRLWTIANLDPDASGSKSIIPCLEPCSIMLEFARRAARLEQDEKITVRLGENDMATLAAALGIALEHPQEGVREGDSGHPANPRRILLVREKLLPYLPSPKPIAD